MNTVSTLMRFRKLRIAWSTLCVSLFVLLIVLWANSYVSCTSLLRDFDDRKVKFTSQTISIFNCSGRLVVASRPTGLWPHPYGWRAYIFRVDGPNHEQWTQGLADSQFEWESSPTQWYIKLPDWLLVLVFGCAGMLPWIHQLKLSFSLRTLLVATTLVAVLLGLIVWASS
jgi:hypothetical protein